MKKGFTLIELLVVVLIIGILAAVALPQYRKSVQKARLAQVDVILDSAKKAVESYMLTNGRPPVGGASLSGEDNASGIDMGICEGNRCRTSAGSFDIKCDEASVCYVQLDTNATTKVASDQKDLWLDGIMITFARDPNSGAWYVDNVNGIEGL